jgi:PAS domain S-box-containing protein
VNLLQQLDASPLAVPPPGDFDVLKLLPVAVYVTDAEGRITFYNDAAAELWGWRPPLGTEWCGSFKLYWPDGRPMPHDQCPMAVALTEQREIRGEEAVLERPDGTRIPFRPYPKPIFDETGMMAGAVNMLVDITRQKRDENLEQRLAAIVESSDDAIISKDLDGTIRTWNTGAERLFGYSAEEAIGNPITMLFPEERLDEEPRIIGQIMRGERVDHYETVRVRKDGSLVDVSLTVSPVKDGKGRVVGASKIARDITAQKETQNRILMLMREVNHRVKNQYAVILSVIRETNKRAPDPERFEAQVRERIMALARSHDLLVLANWRGATIFELLLAQLEPFAIEDSLIMSGPSIVLQPNAVQYLGMAFHELATNSLKYGAMSVPAGTVEVSWKISRGEQGERVFSLSWAERGGPSPGQGVEKGFGSTMLEKVAPMAVGGTATLSLAAEGLAWTIEAPAQQVESAA